jgi:hypothetical protein
MKKLLLISLLFFVSNLSAQALRPRQELTLPQHFKDTSSTNYIPTQYQTRNDSLEAFIIRTLLGDQIGLFQAVRGVGNGKVADANTGSGIIAYSKGLDTAKSAVIVYANGSVKIFSHAGRPTVDSDGNVNSLAYLSDLTTSTPLRIVNTGQGEQLQFWRGRHVDSMLNYVGGSGVQHFQHIRSTVCPYGKAVAWNPDPYILPDQVDPKFIWATGSMVAPDYGPTSETTDTIIISMQANVQRLLTGGLYDNSEICVYVDFLIHTAYNNQTTWVPVAYVYGMLQNDGSGMYTRPSIDHPLLSGPMVPWGGLDHGHPDYHHSWWVYGIDPGDTLKYRIRAWYQQTHSGIESCPPYWAYDIPDPDPITTSHSFLAPFDSAAPTAGSYYFRIWSNQKYTSADSGWVTVPDTTLGPFADSVKTGLLKYYDWLTFKNKLSKSDSTIYYTSLKRFADSLDAIRQSLNFIGGGVSSVTAGDGLLQGLTTGAVSLRVDKQALDTLPAVYVGGDMTLGATSLFKFKGVTSGTMTLTAPTDITDYTLTWPTAQASGTQYLKNISGTLSWDTPTGGGAVSSVTGSRSIIALPTTGDVKIRVDKSGLDTLPAVVVTGNMTFSETSSLKMRGTTSGIVTFGTPTDITNYSLTWPAVQGGVGTYPKNNGSGVLTWDAPVGGVSSVAGSLGVIALPTTGDVKLRLDKENIDSLAGVVYFGRSGSAGLFKLWSASAVGYETIQMGDMSGPGIGTWSLPGKFGTFAMTSDLPDTANQNSKFVHKPDTTSEAPGSYFTATQAKRDSTNRNVLIGKKVNSVDTTTSAGGSYVTPTQIARDTTNRNVLLALKAPLASPTFTGTPAAPTAAVGTNTTQLATTAFVLANAAGNTVLTVYKTTSQLKVDDSYYTNDSSLVVPIAANSTYTYTLDLATKDNGVAGSNFYINMTGPSGSTGAGFTSWVSLHPNTGISTGGGTWGNYPREVLNGTHTMDGSFIFHVFGTIITSSTAGNLQMQWHIEDTGRGVGEILLRGSTMTLVKK